MRLRTSAALALVMALLASPVAALACGLGCWPAPLRAADVEAVDAAPADGSCHRDTDESVDGSFTLSAAPHDCSGHSALETSLTTPKSGNVAPISAASTSTLSAIVQYPLGAAPSRASQSPAHDLAPPGRTPDLIAPLRV